MDSPNHHGCLEDPAETMETHMLNRSRPQKSENVGKTGTVSPNKKSALPWKNNVGRRTAHIQCPGDIMENKNNQGNQVMDSETQTSHANGRAGS